MKNLHAISECAFMKMKKGNRVYNEEGKELYLTEDVDDFTMIAFCDDGNVYECGTLFVCLD